MTEEQIPRRPDTPLADAMEAQERFMQFLLTQVATMSGDPVAFLTYVRSGALDAMAPGTANDAQHRRVADHMDWLLALAEIQMRRKFG